MVTLGFLPLFREASPDQRRHRPLDLLLVLRRLYEVGDLERLHL
jgi:hypothetical protein